MSVYFFKQTTPPKFNMEPGNDGFQVRNLHFPRGPHFQVPAVCFGGWNTLHQSMVSDPGQSMISWILGLDLSLTLSDITRLPGFDYLVRSTFSYANLVLDTVDGSEIPNNHMGCMQPYNIMG